MRQKDQIDQRDQPIYLDNGATSWPKPAVVAEAMTRFLKDIGANPGRAGHRLALDAGRVIYDTREELADFFGLQDPMRLVFTPNVTTALNLILRGMLGPGDRVVTSSMEHNAVMRPLRALESSGLQIDQLPCDRSGRTDPASLSALLQDAGTIPKLLIINHASNVTGTLQPLEQFGRILRSFREERGSDYPLLLVDAAQSAGSVDIDMEREGMDILAFTGHKGLLGPTGTGGLLFGPAVDTEQIDPLVRGGTGSRSEEEHQPSFLPDRFEGGTGNGVGLAGLLASLRWIKKQGLETIIAHEQALRHRLYCGLSGIPGVSLYGPTLPGGLQESLQGGLQGGLKTSLQTTGVISFTMENLPCSEAGFYLDEEFAVLCRVGLHCAPGAHRSIGTFPEGTIRLAPGPFTTVEQIDRTLQAVHYLSRERSGGGDL